LDASHEVPVTDIHYLIHASSRLGVGGCQAGAWQHPVELAQNSLSFVQEETIVFEQAGMRREQGEPALGGLWYGGWMRRTEPSYSEFDPIVRAAKPHIAEKVTELRLRERIADHGVEESSTPPSAPSCCCS
jgi:hypothetical protein